ncbi:MAG: tetratricopeptide repeat protein, partial [Limibacillus sp.]
MGYYDLGSYSRKVTCASEEAQLWFDRGLVWTYAYNHEEAIACFERALEADADCAMAHWGVAYCIGPNYNKPWEAFEEEEKPEALALAASASKKALALKDKLTPVERALIEAMPHRYPDSPEIEEFSPWNDAYAAAMRKVHAEYRD